MIAAQLRLIAPDSGVDRGDNITSLRGPKAARALPDQQFSSTCAEDEKLQGEKCSGAVLHQGFT